MKKILAISGGVDSMLMLYLYRNEPETIVAHFNHGLRPAAAQEAEFVQQTAIQYGLPCIIERAQLPSNASEATAREARYHFLHKIAIAQQGVIFTAHHLDDLVESIIINLLRGTGWRGLTPMQRISVKRPFLETNWLPRTLRQQPPLDKNRIWQLAGEAQLRFYEDASNQSLQFLRNRIRNWKQEQPRQYQFLKRTLTGLAQKQTDLRVRIETVLAELADAQPWSQANWRDCSDLAAIEILIFELAKHNLKITRPQAQKCLHELRTLTNGKKINLPKNRFLTIKRDQIDFSQLT